MKSQRSHRPAWQRPGSPIGRQGRRKRHPKYKRHMNEPWTRNDLGAFRQFAYANTPTGVMSLKLGRTKVTIRSKAQRERISLKPTNRSPYSRKARAGGR